jgi:CubicO group peptidase (beta-lactamase class C family)
MRVALARPVCLGLAFVCFGFTTQLDAQYASDFEDRGSEHERVDALVRAEMERQKIPGVAVAIIEGGEVVMARGYGLANVEHRVPVRSDTIFQSGSVGKQFTAAAVMLLVEDGTLDGHDTSV